MRKLINDAGLALVKHFEGFRSKAYKCPGDRWTIGYGHTLGVYQGMQITKALAEVLLLNDLESSELAVHSLTEVPLNGNQRSALISFVFNLGAGNFKRSTLRRKLNTGDYDAVPEQLRRWVRGGGQILPGLVRRRKAEAKLWST